MRKWVWAIVAILLLLGGCELKVNVRSDSAHGYSGSGLTAGGYNPGATVRVYGGNAPVREWHNVKSVHSYYQQSVWEIHTDLDSVYLVTGTVVISEN